jgi:hypothetical protein
MRGLWLAACVTAASAAAGAPLGFVPAHARPGISILGAHNLNLRSTADRQPQRVVAPQVLQVGCWPQQHPVRVLLSREPTRPFPCPDSAHPLTDVHLHQLQVGRQLPGIQVRGRQTRAAECAALLSPLNCAQSSRWGSPRGPPHAAERLLNSRAQVAQDPTFMPRDGSPKIQVFIRPEGQAETPKHLAERGITVEYDVFECEDFVREDGKWAAAMPVGTLVAAGWDADFVPS